MRERSSAARDIFIPEPADLDRRARLEGQTDEWLSYYIPDIFRVWTPMRREMVHEIENIVTFGGYKAIAATRGEGKTEVTCGVTIKLTLTGVVDFTLIVAANGPMASRILSNIKYYLENSPRLAEDYPEVIVPILRLEGANQRAPTQTYRGERTWLKWSDELAIFPTIPDSRASGTVVISMGIDAALRGLNYRGKRPRLVLIDDPETNETSRSDPQIADRIRVIENDITGLASGDRPMSIIMLNNTPNRKCVGYQFTDRTKRPAWRGKRIPLVTHWPERMDLWDEYVSRRKRELMTTGASAARNTDNWYLENREVMDAGFVTTNPGRFDRMPAEDGRQNEFSAVQAVFNKVADKGWPYVQAELQCDPPEEVEGESESVSAATVASKSTTDYVRKIVPEWCDILTIGTDTGKYLVHWVVVAWRLDGTCHVVDYGKEKVLGTVKNVDEGVVEAIQAALLKLVGGHAPRLWARHGEPNRPKQFDRWLIDAGYKNTAIYNAIRTFKNPKVGACIGTDSHNAPQAIRSKIKAKMSPFHRPGLESCQSFQDQHNVRLWLTLINSDWWKQWVRDRITTAAGNTGAMTIFCEEDDARTDHTEFCEHIADERWDMKKHKFSEQSGRNHYGDALYYAAVAASQCGVALITTENRGKSAPSGQPGNTMSELYRRAQEKRALSGRK